MSFLTYAALRLTTLKSSEVSTASIIGPRMRTCFATVSLMMMKKKPGMYECDRRLNLLFDFEYLMKCMVHSRNGFGFV